MAQILMMKILTKGHKENFNKYCIREIIQGGKLLQFITKAWYICRQNFHSWEIYALQQILKQSTCMVKRTIHQFMVCLN